MGGFYFTPRAFCVTMMWTVEVAVPTGNLEEELV